MIIKYKIIKKGQYGFIEPIPQDKLKRILNSQLSYDNKFYPGMPKWMKKTNLYKDKKGAFRWGLIFRVLKVFKAYSKYDYNFEYEYDNPIKNKKIEGLYYDKELRKYQMEAIKKFLYYGLGIIQLPCGAGKTRLTLEIMKQLEIVPLVIVHTKELKKQWEEQFGGDVVTYQYLIKHLDKVKKYNFIIYDECHLCKCKSIKQIALNSNPDYVLGLSASPKREDLHDMQIEEVCGQVIYSKTTEQLISQGYLSNAKVIMQNINYKNDYFENYSEVYQDNIIDNDERNGKILDIIVEDRNISYCLILVDRIEHGKMLYEDIKKIDANTIFFYSSMKNRKDEYEKIKNKKYNIIISSQIFDTGIDFPWLTHLILACGGKSSVKIIQRTGRLLRKCENKKQAIIYDFFDNARMLKKHSNIRLKYYKESGFDVERIN